MMEEPQATCPSCQEEGTLRPTMARTSDGTVAAKADPLGIGHAVHGVFLNVECSECPWEQDEAKRFIGPDPTSERTAVAFGFDDPEDLLEPGGT